MKIKYQLLSNSLTVHGETKNFIARVQSTGRLTEAEIIERMEKSTGLGRGDIIGVLESYHRAVETAVSQGYIVSTLTFKNPDLPPGRYRLLVRARFGQNIRQGHLAEKLLCGGESDAD